MRWRRIDRVFWAWTAAAALLAGVVSPAVMQPGRAIEGQAPWADVCSRSGPVAGEGGDAPWRPSTTHRLGHCPICSLHGALLALPPPAAYAIALLSLAFELAPRFAWATPPSRHWLPAQPRGPPLRA